MGSMGGKGGLLSRGKSRLEKVCITKSVIRVGPSIRARWLKMFKITLEIVTLENRGKAAVTSKNPPVPPIKHIVKQQFLGSYGMVFWRTEGLGDGLLALAFLLTIWSLSSFSLISYPNDARHGLLKSSRGASKRRLRSGVGG